MVNYREILRLHSLGYSKRSIESSVGSSHQTVKDVLDRAKEMHIEWPLDEDITNAVLNEHFFLRGRRISPHGMHRWTTSTSTLSFPRRA